MFVVVLTLLVTAPKARGRAEDTKEDRKEVTGEKAEAKLGGRPKSTRRSLKRSR